MSATAMPPLIRSVTAVCRLTNRRQDSVCPGQPRTGAPTRSWMLSLGTAFTTKVHTRKALITKPAGQAELHRLRCTDQQLSQAGTAIVKHAAADSRAADLHGCPA